MIVIFPSICVILTRLPNQSLKFVTYKITHRTINNLVLTSNSISISIKQKNIELLRLITLGII